MRKLATILILVVCGTLLSGCRSQEHTKNKTQKHTKNTKEYTKNTKFPGPRYFKGRVSEGEIYAGAIIALFGESREGPQWSIIYLKSTLGDNEQKQLPKYVEQLVYKPLRPIIHQDNDRPYLYGQAKGKKVEKRWPVNRPIKRVADASYIGKYIWPKGASEPSNNVTFVTLESIKRVGDHVEITVDNSDGDQSSETIDFEVTLSNGRLKYDVVWGAMSSSEKRIYSFNRGN